MNDNLIAEFLADMDRTGKTANTLGIVVRAVKFAWKQQGLENPVGLFTESVMRGIRRKSPAPKQAMGLTWEDVDRIVAVTLKDGTMWRLRDACIVSLMSDAMLRISEVAGIKRSDITYMDNHSTLYIHRSKTTKEGDGDTLYVCPATVRILKEWIREAKVGMEERLFLPIYQGTVVHKPRRGLTKYSISKIVQDRAKAADITGNVKGHNLRVGAAQSLAEAGASVVEIQQAGRWKSPNMLSTMPATNWAERGCGCEVSWVKRVKGCKRCYRIWSRLHKRLMPCRRCSIRRRYMKLIER